MTTDKANRITTAIRAAMVDAGYSHSSLLPIVRMASVTGWEPSLIWTAITVQTAYRASWARHDLNWVAKVEGCYTPDNGLTYYVGCSLS